MAPRFKIPNYGGECASMPNSVYEIPVSRIDGTETTLGDYKGKALLIVNVASKCGLTPQYEGLEKLYEQYRDKGLEVLGFPANNFLAQEPGTNEEIQEFCRSNYNVQFPLFEKISVKGGDSHELYNHLIAERPAADIDNGNEFEERLKGYGQVRENAEDILWNFEKFLIDREGNVAARIAPDVTVEDERVVAAVDKTLAG
jgi:glutathione peroxidase